MFFELLQACKNLNSYSFIISYLAKNEFSR
eukprot:UN05413